MFISSCFHASGFRVSATFIPACHVVFGSSSAFLPVEASVAIAPVRRRWNPNY
ncbi:hypothetical protein AA0115_g12542 [Alternaria tenuissima]|uniref:Uncharacterized protein n=1 Tax=Alternaria tenuissima TaxID=119927 RepID=A0AB37VY60_9PLEO|nr:hypothetical protein AA0115_g12542 [Alternaria tenuissima]